MFNRVDETSRSTNRKKSHVNDREFGIVTCRRSAQSRFVRIRVTEQGDVRASLPLRAPLYMVQELLDASREEIRTLVAAQKAKRVHYRSGMTIGHSHRLNIVHGPVDTPKRSLKGQDIIVTIPMASTPASEHVQSYISSQVRRALKREAMAYLPRRLRYLADQYGFVYDRERFGNQSGRWGSCSSSGTISLNVALMNLPHVLIDYVLIHELAHTSQMNHSRDFWDIVERCMPDYREHRKLLKNMSPIG